MEKDLGWLFGLMAKMQAEQEVEFLLIGGFAVNYYGYTRNTLDVDFMVAVDRIDPIREWMKQAGFTNISEQENVVFFNRPGSALRVDFLKVDPTTMSVLLSQAQQVDMHGHTIKIPSLRDLLAMKLFALKNSFVRRKDKDLPDVAYLCLFNDLDMDKELRPLCDQFADDSIYDLICNRIEELTSC